MALLITGGLGYNGSSILEQIIENKSYEWLTKEPIYILDNLQRTSGLGRYFFFKRYLNNLHLILQDISEDSIFQNVRLKEALKDIDKVIHMAGITGAAFSKDNYKITENGTKNILDLIKDNSKNIKIFINISSTNCYGFIDSSKVVNEDDTPNPVNDYAKAKLNAEKICREYYEKDGLPIITIRFSTNFAFSSGMRRIFINKYFIEGIVDKKMVVHSDKTCYRPFIPVYEVADFLIDLIKRDNIERFGEVYNLGDEEYNVRLDELAEIIVELFKKKFNYSPEVLYECDLNPEFVKESYRISFEKVRSELGFKMRESFLSAVNNWFEKFIEFCMA